MDRRKFLYTSGVITSGLILHPQMLRANPILGFFAELLGSVAINLISDGITSWIKDALFDDDFKENVANHTSQLNSNGYNTYPSVYTFENYFYYPTIKGYNNGNYSDLITPFFCYCNESKGNIIDMYQGEFGNLSSVAGVLKKRINPSPLRDSLMPMSILDRPSFNKKSFDHIIYSSVNNTEVRYRKNKNNNKGYFTIDGPLGKDAGIYYNNYV
jgi:hypothetical protein